MKQPQETLSPLGVILITHGTIGIALKDTLIHVMGEQPFLEVVSIENEEVPNERGYITLINEKIQEVNQGRGVVLLTDMFGGTPSNLALGASSHKEIPVEVIAGVNLPLLIKLVEIRNKLPLFEAAREAQAAARKYIHVASDLLKM